jgi:spermidine synthase
MLAHPALFSHPAPRRVLIVGGGDCGTLREVCKHPEVEQVTQVDIDERVTRVAEQFLPELCTANTDPRARLVFDDGIRWVRESDPGSLDVILVDSTDPVGPAAGLFTADFYRDCRRALAEGGLLVQQSESPLAHLGTILAPMHEALAEAGFGGPATFHFPQPIYPTGWWSVTAAGRDGPVTFARAGAAGDPGFPTEYYTAAIHHAAQALPAFVARALPGRE